MGIENSLERIAVALEKLAANSGPAGPDVSVATPVATTTAPSTTVTPPPAKAAKPPKKAAPASAPVAQETAAQSPLSLREDAVNAIMTLANGVVGEFASQRAAAISILQKYGANTCAELKNENLQSALADAVAAIEDAKTTKAGISLI